MSQSPANKFIAAIIVASKGEDFVPNTLKQNLGEHTLWTGQGSYHETGRTASTYVGGSSGVSIPFGGGISFRVRAIKGQVIPDEKLQSDNFLGVGLLTTERLVFSGPTHTRE